MNLGNVMEEIAGRAATIQGLNHYDFPTKHIEPPSFIVSYPRNYVFDATYGRGMDRMTIEAVLVVGNVDAEDTKDNLGEYCDGSGPKSLKQVLQTKGYVAFDTLHVTGIVFDVIAIAGAPYMAAVFSMNITGQGTR